MNNCDANSITSETQSHEPTTEFETVADLQDMLIDVLGGKASEVADFHTVKRTPDGFGHVPKEQFDEEYLRLIKLDLAESLKHRHEMPEEAKRGLLDATLDFFHVGYLPNWVLTKSRAEFNCGTYVDKETGEVKHLPPPSERMIIPTASGTHFNAVATPMERFNIHKDFWKQHAGEKELFCDPAALEVQKTLLVVEGEVDAMTIWQASKGKIPVVAILGASNWKKTLLPILDDCRKLDKSSWELFKTHGKPVRFVLMLDGDAAGRRNGERLVAELLKRGYPAVYRSLYDLLMRRGEKLYKQDKKVDANEYYCNLKSQGANDNAADTCLYGLIQECIIDGAKDELDKLEAEIKQGKYAVKDKPTNTEFSAGKGDINADEIKLMLKDFVHAKDLTRDEWWAVGAILFRYGFTLDDFKKWSSIDDPRYDVTRCDIEWNGYKTADELQGEDASGYTIGTLIQLAKQNGYVPPRRDPHVTGDKTIDKQLADFQDQFGEINPDILPKIQAAKIFIDGLTPQNFKASLAFERSTLSKVALCKFYLPSTAQKFFDTLKDARALAKSILKQIAQETAAKTKSADSIPAVDTTELTRLSELPVSKIQEETDSLVTTLKRTHKAFVKHLQSERRIAAEKAAVDAYNANPAWTQTQMPDCPINLILPDSVYFDAKGVGTQTFTERGRVQERTATKTPIVPTKIFREPRTHVTRYEVAIKSRHHWRNIIVEGDELADSRKILRLATDGGAIIKDAKALTDYFADIIAANEDRLPEVTCYTRPGWYEDKFIYPTPTNEDSYIVRRAGIDYESIFAVRGDSKLWLDKFREFCGGQQDSLKRFIFGGVIVAPMLKVIEIPNVQFLLEGGSNKAKTPAVKMGLSVFGDPREGKLMRTWDSSDRNRLALALGFCDLPLFLDEGETMTQKKKASLSEDIYNYFSGITDQRNRRNGDLKQAESFRGCRWATGEMELLGDTAKRGAFKRLVTIHVNDELFSDDAARKLHLFVAKNHGHFGRQWTTYIEAHAAEIAADFDALCDHFADRGFIRDGLHAELKSVDATNARSVIACAVAFWHFRLCLHLDQTLERNFAIADAEKMLAQLPTIDEIDELKRGIELLASWVVAHPRRFITPAIIKGVEVDGVDNPADTYASTVGKQFADGNIAFIAGEFSTVCEECRIPSYKRFLSDLYNNDCLECKNSRDKSIQKKINGRNTKVYMIKSGVLFSEDNERDDY